MMEREVARARAEAAVEQDRRKRAAALERVAAMEREVDRAWAEAEELQAMSEE
jgi:hypothetical protein